jgi:SRSO17 transposase
VDNCVVTVHICYAAGDFHTLLAGELFLPQEWSDDRQRCRAAGIPDEMVHRPKWEISLELRDWAVANGVRFEWVTNDEGYGEVPAFHFGMDDRGQRYVAEVPCIFHGWMRRPAVLQKQHRSPHKRGAKPRYPRLKVKNSPTIEARNMVTYCEGFREQSWEKFHIKDSTLGPVVWEAKAAPIYLKRDGLPTWPHWLIVARNMLDPDEVKYFVSNAPAGTPLEVMLHVAFQRYHVERCFEEEKGELGMDHFEVRNYTSLKRHLLLTAVSHLFLAKVRQKWRGEKSAPDGLPTSPGDRGAGALAVADRTGSYDLLGEGSRNHYRDPAAEREVRAQPRESPQAAVA